MTGTEIRVEPVAAAGRIGPTLRHNAGRADRDGRLPAESIEALRDAGFFRLYVPRSLDGTEIDPVTYARAQEELARHDAAAAWTLQAAGSSAWWCSRLPDETVAEIYADGPASSSPCRSRYPWRRSASTGASGSQVGAASRPMCRTPAGSG